MRIARPLRIASLPASVRVSLLAGVLSSALLAGCALPRPAADSVQQAEAAGFRRELVQANGFALTALVRSSDPQAPLRVYIEGDGRAWLDRNTVSDDPTPRRPLALQLALADPSANVAWLARPCQFTLTQSPACQPAHWSGRRFAPEVIAAMGVALDRLAARPGRPLELVAHSGGAAIAVALAAQRKQVTLLVTVAGNLDSEAVNRFHQVDAMPDSLNPVTLAPQLAGLPQRHLVGTADKVVPASVAAGFIAAGRMRCAELVTVPGAGHESGWLDYWRAQPGLFSLPGCRE